MTLWDWVIVGLVSYLVLALIVASLIGRRLKDQTVWNEWE